MIRNEVKLIGRLTADPELKYTKKNKQINQDNGGINYVQNHFNS